MEWFKSYPMGTTIQRRSLVRALTPRRMSLGYQWLEVVIAWGLSVAQGWCIGLDPWIC